MSTDKTGSGREGGRSLKTRVKSARKRSLSSTLWLSRQLNDPYVARARTEGYRSRAAFKLIEIDDQYKLLRPGARIVDLGAAPAAGRRSRPSGSGLLASRAASWRSTFSTWSPCRASTSRSWISTTRMRSSASRP